MKGLFTTPNQETIKAIEHSARPGTDHKKGESAEITFEAIFFDLEKLVNLRK